ncbi:hypothetical protein PENSTE_c009G07844 [Penicillium steckii]|uniref:Uncharacterized protein n=1 Tax=Penicillium steckii TaxID=303698 RepID=A0A1V6TAH5_9EURO|nr:hypothetical protein PENSTE_c009G07844 [Penicillium steckii]
MQFKLASAVALLAAVSPALASPLSAQLQELSASTAQVNEIFSDVTLVNFFQQMPKGFHNYQDVIKSKSKDIQNSPSMIIDEEQPAVCEDFVTFATITQDLMNTLIGKHGLLSQTPFTAPVAALLRTDEGVTDALVFNVKGLAPKCEEQIKAPADKLQDAYSKALKTYSD